jgi:hypothetical protein
MTISIFLAGGLSVHVPHHTVSSLADYILNIVLFANVERDLPRTRGVRLTGGHDDCSLWLMGLKGDQ